MIPELPGGPPVPESPPIISSADLAAAIRGSADQMSDRLGAVLAELVGSLKPGANVREMPSDSFECWTGAAMPGGTQLLVPAMETRTRITLWSPTGSVVWLSSSDGVPLSPTGNGNTFLLKPDSSQSFGHRAAIYAGTTEAVPQLVYCLAEFANY